MVCSSLFLVWTTNLAATNDPIEFTFQGSVNFGYADGFLQTPLGGEPGTSTRRRPTFHELNMDDVVFYDTGLKVRWRQIVFEGGYQFIRFNESGTLSRPLTTRGVDFNAGADFKTNDRFDWYHAGIGWRFDLLARRLELLPMADFAVLDFSYKFSGVTESVNRSYAKGCGGLGFEGRYAMTERLSLSLGGAASLPLSNTPQIAIVTSTLNFRLLGHERRINPSVFVGGGAEWIDYEDNQRLPNHVRSELGPFVTGGLALSF